MWFELCFCDGLLGLVIRLFQNNADSQDLDLGFQDFATYTSTVFYTTVLFLPELLGASIPESPHSLHNLSKFPQLLVKTTISDARSLHVLPTTNTT